MNIRHVTFKSCELFVFQPEVERGTAQAIQETATVAAEEGKVAAAAEGVGGAFGWLREQPLRRSRGGSDGGSGRGACGRCSLTVSRGAPAGCLRTRLPA